MAEQEYVTIQTHIVFNGKKKISETCTVIAKSSSVSKKFKKILLDDYGLDVKESITHA